MGATRSISSKSSLASSVVVESGSTSEKDAQEDHHLDVCGFGGILYFICPCIALCDFTKPLNGNLGSFLKLKTMPVLDFSLLSALRIDCRSDLSFQDCYRAGNAIQVNLLSL